MIPIAIKLFLGATSWLKEALWRVLSLARTYPLQTALITSLAFSVWLWRGWSASDAGWKAERLAHAETIKAGQQAYAAQVALNKAAEAKSAAIAKETDIAHSKDLADANAAADRYIAANRVRPHGGSGAGKAGASAEDQTAGRSDATSEQTELVAVPAADVRICTANTLRLEAVRDWGIALKDAGLGE